ncbi:condensation domain-containing protein [Catenulispora yoronensis]
MSIDADSIDGSAGTGLDADVDISLADLDRDAVRAVLTKFRAGSVTRVCQLSPLQQGLLFETLKNPGEGNYLTQTVYEVDQDLDPETFVAAWRFVRGRHEALRTTFVVDDVPHPVQVVHRTAPAQVRTHDWSTLGAPDQAERLELLLSEHRHGDPELTEAPPLAFDLIKVGAGRYRIVWHVHHLLIDGASSAKVLDELALAYACLADRGEFPVLPRPAQFGEHVAWLATRDQDADAEQWRTLIGDLSEPTPLACAAPAGAEEGHQSRSIVRTADSGFVADLADFAGRHNCTVHTVVQAAWALVVASRSGRSDVCWGTIFSGRGADYSRVADVVGLVINTVPVRSRLDPAETVGSWLLRLQQTLSTARRLEHMGLDRIRRVSGVAGGEELFETLFQFVPEAGPADDGFARLALRRVHAVEQAGYPWTCPSCCAAATSWSSTSPMSRPGSRTRSRTGSPTSTSTCCANCSTTLTRHWRTWSCCRPANWSSSPPGRATAPNRKRR